MGFNKSASFTYKTLEGKYNGYLAPDFLITIGSTKLESIKVPITNLTVKQTIGGAASASFTIVSLYDYEKSKWVDELVAKIDVGQKVSIEAGYAATRKRIFLGYVDSYSVDFNGAGSPSISVNAFDAMVLLENDKHRIDFGNKTYDDIVKTLIANCKVDEFIEKKTIDKITVFTDKKKNAMISEKAVSTAGYLKMLAEMQGFNFCIIDGELLFTGLMDNTKSLMTLSMGSTLLSFNKRVALTKDMVGKVVVRSTGDPTKKEFLEASADSIKVGSGKIPADFLKAIKASKLEITVEPATTKEALEKIAQEVMKLVSLGFLEATATCIGIPEMCPGRYITLEGLDKRSNGDYFVTDVVHSFTESGYSNTITMKGFKVK